MKKKRWAVVAGVVVLLLVVRGVVWANPGDEKWKYPSSGGIADEGGGFFLGPKVLITPTGDRVLITTQEQQGVVVCLDREGHLKWQKFYSGSSSGTLSLKKGSTSLYKNGMLHGAFHMDGTVDSKGNIIVTGFEENASNNTDIYVISYSPAGDVNWLRTYDSGKDDYTPFVTVNSQDEIFVVETIRQGPSPDGWGIISYSSTGHKLWEKSFSATVPVANNIVADSNDNIIVTDNTNFDVNSKWEIRVYTSDGTEMWHQSSTFTDARLRSITLDSHDNIVAVGTANNGSTYDWKIVSYNPSGGTRWERSYNSGDNDTPFQVITGQNDTITVVGCEGEGKAWRIISYDSEGNELWQASLSEGTDNNLAIAAAADSYNHVIVGGMVNDALRVVAYDSQGNILWQNSYNSTDRDVATWVTVDETTGEVVVAGSTLGTSLSAIVLDYEGYPPPNPAGHVLYPQELRTIQPAAETPDPDNGTYLGFGDVVAKGTHFKIEAAFPRYLNPSDNSTLPVKIFVAGVLPSLPTTLLFFNTSDALGFLPLYPFSPWRRSLVSEVGPVTLIPTISLSDPSVRAAFVGTNYWYTLVVPDSVPDDFSGVDWESIPWELTVNVFEVK